MRDILSIGGEPVFDDRIVKIESHTYNPYANTTFGYSDKIRIPIQQLDLYTLPCESFLYVEEIRYELDGVEIDRNRNVGITSTIKNYASLTAERGKILKNAGWDLTAGSSSVAATGDFNFCVPLDTLLGFCEDYKRVVINARHELIRARNDNNCLISREEYEPRVELTKLQWRMPHVVARPNSWAVKAATQLEKPRYVIFALQTGKKNVLLQDASRFDACNLTNVKLYLNSDFYPYDDMNLDFDKHKIAVLYDAYARFRRTYYRSESDETLLTMNKFLYCGPLVVIDCSRQSEAVKSATVDVRLEFDCKDNVPSNTTAYCLIIHDRVVEYNPLTNVVRKIL
ncbi:Double jelly roll-like domain-containing protein [Camponotus japonicus]